MKLNLIFLSLFFLLHGEVKSQYSWSKYYLDSLQINPNEQIQSFAKNSNGTIFLITSPQHIPFNNPDSIILKLYQSKDNGDTWTYKNSFCFDLIPNTNFYCEVYLYVIGSNLFLRYYSGINNAFYYSNDNGMSWKSVSGINGTLFSQEAYHDNLISVSSKKSYYALLLDSAFVYSSVDSGMTWTPTSIINISDTLTNYSFFYSINDTLYINTIVYANNGRNMSFKSYDGYNWTPINHNFIANQNNMFQVSDNEYFATQYVAVSPYLSKEDSYYSNDKCKTWNKGSEIDYNTEITNIIKTNNGYIATTWYKGDNLFYKSPFSKLYVNPIHRNPISVVAYPNPTSTDLNIDIEDILEIEIYETTGKLVLSIKKPTSKQINIESLNEGIYYLRLTTESGILSQKFIKQ